MPIGLGVTPPRSLAETTFFIVNATDITVSDLHLILVGLPSS